MGHRLARGGHISRGMHRKILSGIAYWCSRAEPSRSVVSAYPLPGGGFHVGDGTTLSGYGQGDVHGLFCRLTYLLCMGREQFLSKLCDLREER